MEKKGEVAKLFDVKALSKIYWGAIIAILIVAGSVGAYVYWSTLPKSETNEFELRVGALCALTGVAAYRGIGMRDGAIMALEEINAAGGLNGKPVNLIIEDEGTTGDSEVKAVQKLITSDDVHFLIGIVAGSGAALAAAPVACDAKVPLILTYSSSDALTQLVVDNYARYKYLFRTSLNLTAYSTNMIAFMNMLGKTRYYYISEDMAYAHYTESLLTNMTKGTNLTRVGISYWPLTVQDFTPELLKIKEAKPEVVIQFGAMSPNMILVRQYQSDPELRKIPILIGSAGEFAEPDKMATLEKAFPGITNNLAMAEMGTVSARLSAGTSFIDKFKARFGRSPTGTYEARMYDAVYMIVQLVNQTQSLDPDVFVGAMEQINYKGIDARYTFAKDSHSSILGPENCMITWQLSGANRTYLLPSIYATGTYVYAG